MKEEEEEEEQKKNTEEALFCDAFSNRKSRETFRHNSASSMIMDGRWTVPNTTVATHRRVVKTLLFVKVVLLLSTLCASFGRARDDDDAKQKRFDDGKETRLKEGNFDFVVVDDPFRANACLDAELYCEQTVAPAVEQDATLRQFLRDARKDARTMHSWDTIVPKAMKIPETLAMGTTTRETHHFARRRRGGVFSRTNNTFAAAALFLFFFFFSPGHLFLALLLSR